MNSYRISKLNAGRPGSSARVYDYANSNYESIERRSKIPKMPKRTYSLEGEKSTYSNRKSSTKNKPSTTSMIPRPEWRKTRKIHTELLDSGENLPDKLTESAIETSELETTDPETGELESDQTPVPVDIAPCASFHSPASRSTSTMEAKVNKDLTSFKNSVLRIPEYWTDAGETVTSILKNAINIITKQYPTADVESFEKDIESILRATETVKQQILTRTENIINKANQIYSDKNERNPAMPDEDLKKITRKISELKNEVYYRKNVFGDLLKYGSEMKELLELEKSLKHKALLRDNIGKDALLEAGKNDHEIVSHGKHPEGKRSKTTTEAVILHSKKTGKHSMQSCGDIVRQGTKILLEAEAKSDILSRPSAEEKSTQTPNSWYDELRAREKDLKDLNRQITELHQLCKDHISKFKNFNLQIKMRGISNKPQHAAKDVFIHNNDNLPPFEKNNNNPFASYSKDLESAIKQKDLDLHHKEKLITQQKKLLHVRDQLIGMLKNRCNLDEHAKRRF